METSELVTIINTLQWNLHFHKFCEILNINPDNDNNYEYAIEKVNELSNLSSSLTERGLENLEQMKVFLILAID
ncbi:hypothetical protein [Lyngbya sp. PCC 8106]|uniref:hypothetical protein n=1 Tax=Lyngbya sp. (strain PCC 8106) TaxID=313612 RepID=UPI0000EA993D|nr:hypothetical protein [Lyngbya sp. PCC 8106]EAW33377.1 hypothetical protein L8106_22756 [Lyngbya sp. PCC 8106]EAW35130.1 hypothetical protein L8106_13485 [Lyngbya sp. PCC 8106]